MNHIVNIFAVIPTLSTALLCACNAQDLKPHIIADLSQQEYARLARQSLESLESLRFEVQVTDQRDMKNLRMPREKGTTHTKFKVSMADGGRYHVKEWSNDKPIAKIVCDGKEIYEWCSSDSLTHSVNTWTHYPVSIGNAIRFALLMSNPGILHYARSWTDTDAYRGRQIQETLESSDTNYKTTELEDGQLVDIFVNRQSQFAWQIIQHADETTTLYFNHRTHLLQKEKDRQKWTGVAKSGWSKTETRYRNVELNPSLSADVFSFKPPVGAKYVQIDDKRFNFTMPSAFVGEKAPDFSLTSLAGEKTSLSDIRRKNKAIILTFWATWCAPCRKEIPLLRSLHKEFSKAGLAILAVTGEKDALSVKRFAKKEKLPYTVLLDPHKKTGALYRLKTIPRTILINRAGRIVKVWQGWGGKNEEVEIRQKLAKLLR